MPVRRLFKGLQGLALKTKLLLMMMSLLVLSGASLFFLHLWSESKLLSQVADYTEELSTAIEIAQEQPAAEGDPKIVLAAYAEKLRKLGVKDVTLTDAEDEVQASTNPNIVGKRLVRRGRGKAFVIKGVLGDAISGSQGTSTFTIPILVGDRKMGTLLVTRYLDPFSELSHEAFVNRLIATLAVFAMGMLFSLYLAWSFSRPLAELTEAAQRVAAGDLGVQVKPTGADEIASLSRTFNEMVERLREKRQIEERLHFAERSTALGRLASGVAHEIRNPLNLINLSIDHMRQRLGPAEPERRADFDRILENMKSEISRLNRLVGDFLSFGKPMRLDPRPCAVAEVLRDVASLVEHKARDQSIAISLVAEEGLPRIVADPELLKTCFLNLMINAVDAMPQGGLLGLVVRRLRGDGLDEIEIEVKDNGQGMTGEEIRSAFEPYFSTKDTGLGLGLALTQKIVSDHGGNIFIESEPGAGTSVRLRLPVRASALPAQPLALPAVGAGAR
jgi:signal transduction histidine kinase